MEVKSTFITAGVPMTKYIGPQGTTRSYPLVKLLSSHEISYPPTNAGLASKVEEMRRFAKIGGALYKGHFTRPLVQESRSGLTKNMRTRNLILDLDGFELYGQSLSFPMTQQTATELTEQIVDLLPTPFQGVSYIVHLSSSMGLKGNKIQVHIDFLLNADIEQTTLKHLLESLNFDIPAFNQQVTLTNSGRALHYPVDPCLAENARIVFIADPVLEGIDDPIDGDRIFLVQKTDSELDIHALIKNLKPKVIRRKKQALIADLQEAMGVEVPRSNVQRIKIAGTNNSMSVETNPGSMSFEEVSDNDDYVHYNINGGDSKAYYVRKEQPEIVYNFKGEPPFWFETANAEAYQAHLDKYPPKEHGGNTHKPLVFRDLISDQHYNALYDPRTRLIDEIYPAQKGNLEDFMLSYGDILPSPIPIWRYVFDPTTDTTLDINQGFINKFSKPELMQRPASLDPGYSEIEYSKHLATLAEVAPTVHRIIYSAVGNDEECFNHFINWLGYVFQNRKMTRTAFLMQGTFGTGKGLVYQILSQIFGKYATIKKVDNLDEDYNSWLETSLIVCVDEFAINDSKHDAKLNNKIKNYITEGEGTIRAMRENQKPVKLFANWLFFTNSHNSYYIEHNDRRMNVCPRQEIPINLAYSDWEQTVEQNLSGEIEKFAGYLANVLVDESLASTVLKNEARSILMEASRSTVDEFRDAVTQGRFYYFAQTLDAQMTGDRGDNHLVNCQNVTRAWIDQLKRDPDKPITVWIENLRPFYNYFLGTNIATGKFSSLLRKKGLNTVTRQIDGAPREVIDIPFQLTEVDVNRLAKKFLGTRHDHESDTNNTELDHGDSTTEAG